MKGRIMAGMLAAGIAAGCMGCGTNTEQEKVLSENTVKLTDDAEENRTVSVSDMDMEEAAEQADRELFRKDTANFSITLLQKTLENGQKNVMVSPTSVLTAMTMTANGAQGDTLSQMQQVLGANQSLEQLNQNLKEWTESLENTEETGVKFANSIWFKDEKEKIQVQEDFLKKNAAYYQTDIFKAPFDKSTLSDINGWVAEKTEGRIREILNEIPDEAVMYLIHALAFEGEWQNIYYENEIHDGTFYTEDGEEEKVSFMYGEENIYLQDENASGFIKPYKNGYSFAAILPKEGMSTEEYVNSLDGEGFLKLIEAQKKITVHTALPKFEQEYETEMKDVLTALGMKDAFSAEKADFTRLGVSQEGNLCINRVLHKTYISVDERGTEAGAAAVVEMVCETAMEEMESAQVYLDRPFVYAIIENETSVPLFIGTADSIGAQN